MTAEKHKRQHSLPNRQLAQAFRFSSADLAANRAGYLTQAQAWSIPLWMRGYFHQLSQWSPLKNIASQERKKVGMLCGRVTLSYEQQQIQSIFHSDIIEIYKLRLTTMDFRLTAQQHQAIGEGVVYRLYYHLDTKQIVSLERAINGCFDN